MLSKSDFLKFLQCEKYLWLYKHKKDLLVEVSETQQAIFDRGFTVESYAERLLPKGKLQMVARAPFAGKPNQLYARADIVQQNEETGLYDIYEVKSTSGVKAEHLPDLAFQKIAFEGAGYKIGRTFLVHLNSEYVRDGEIVPEKLLSVEDVTEDVNEMVKNITPLIPEALATIEKKEEVQVRIIKQCTTPYACPFIPYCWPQANIPEYSVYDLTGIREKPLIELLDRGVVRVEDVPADIKLTAAQAAQVKVAKSGKTIMEKAKIKKVLARLKYPLYFLDYEAVNPGIPLWDGTRPYQQVCFQYSLHVLRAPGAELEHFEYLAEGQGNPVPGLLAQLRKDIGSDAGSVIVWYKSFEMGRNVEMAEMFPEYREFLEGVNGRVFDLFEIFKKGYFVHPDFRGSNSIKDVLPALVPELDYGNLEDVREGTMASLRWEQVNFGAPMEAGEREKVRWNLLRYCERDTLAMVRVLEVLRYC